MANFNDSTIEKFNSSGVGTQFNVSGDLNNPGALACDSSGNLYVANRGDSTIEKFNSSGDLFVANIGGTVHETSPTGTDLGTFASGLAAPEDVAFSHSAAVPELSSVLGFGSFVALGGFALVRRRKPNHNTA